MLLAALDAAARARAAGAHRPRDAQELAQHVELRPRRRCARASSAAEARRQARLELGDPQEARERLREGRAGSRLDALCQGPALRAAALRSKRPAFTRRAC